MLVRGRLVVSQDLIKTLGGMMDPVSCCVPSVGQVTLTAEGDGAGLVLALWQVHLSTHDPINKNTAKASLQQMLSVVFSRMELKDKELKEVSIVWDVWIASS